MRLDAKGVAQPAQCLQVARQGPTGETESGKQHRLGTDTRLETQNFRQAMAVRTDNVAEIAQLVGKADRQSKEAIERMLGHFRRA
ncbi:MAG: hypothetical protein NT154_07170 [Verrucomicrobia bacterium]|nr:hypothetical protein [Verrucomicrobiota bacterium]